MIIGIDGNEANVSQRVGSNVYAFELLTYFAKPSKHHFVIYLKEKPLTDLPEESKHWQYRLVRPKKFSTRLGLPLTLLIGKSRPDVFFTPGHYLPPFTAGPGVMSIMDMSYIHFPEMFKKTDLWQLCQWTTWSVKKAQKILTISQFSKNAIINHYQIAPEKVVVTPLGFRMSSKTKSVDLAKKYGVEGDYVLYVGTLQPRKNLLRLIKAFSQLKDRGLKLVIVGKKGWLYGEIFKLVKKKRLTDRVIFTGFVPDADLPAFYRQAKCFVLASLYEGFGLPILEAMAYGCPVVASSVSSLPEVVGEAGVLVDPKKPEDIAQGIESAIKNRDDLVKKGHRQVKKFSWEKCAKETLKVIEGVVKDA